MLVSLERRFIFIHIPKAAGTSIIHALRPYARASLPRRLLHRVGFGGSSLPQLPDHAKALDVRAAMPEVFANSFKFAVVRNPWAWQVSYYHYIRQNRKHWQHAEVAPLSFAQYVEWRVVHDRLLQSDFVVDDDRKLMVDSIARVESLDRDAVAIFDRIGVETRLPHRNRSRHDDYRAYYDDRTRALVAEHWAEDVERFGYSFE